jgi:hypothetical protein
MTPELERASDLADIVIPKSPKFTEIGKLVMKMIKKGKFDMNSMMKELSEFSVGHIIIQDFEPIPLTDEECTQEAIIKRISRFDDMTPEELGEVSIEDVIEVFGDIPLKLLQRIGKKKDTPDAGKNGKGNNNQRK